MNYNIKINIHTHGAYNNLKMTIHIMLNVSTMPKNRPSSHGLLHVKPDFRTYALAKPTSLVSYLI